ncbi:hypothetical protein NLU13_7005 [Sarocladium strictum]|uniref:USP domain-containing protein n=1 Tax=Sarocladium strictum TaxID=5046 RepID=A0AA39GFP5_SARSR|nr:hypothetical protein NLU13_7005 [Sarocladium strictum]
MDSPSCADRPASAEGNSTRPNPFDDTDASSRKRRRTGSPVDEVEPLITALDGSSDQANNFDIDTSVDKIRNSKEREPRRQPSSSKVTLNLRQTSTTPISLHSSPSRSDTLPEDKIPNQPPAEAVHKSVESVLEEAQTHSVEHPAPVTPPSGMISPSADVMSVQDDKEEDEDEEEEDLSTVLPATALRAFHLEAGAPIPNFPFHNGNDEIIETLQHIMNHMNTQSPFASEVLASVNTWLGTFIPLLQNLDDRAVIHVCENGRFWHHMPELMHDIVKQTVSTPVILSTESRAAIVDFYQNYTLLTAAFIAFDHRSLREYATKADRTNAQLPDLFATNYLCQLVGPLGFGLPPIRNRETSLVTDLLRARHDIAHCLQMIFRDNTEDNWDSLRRLIQIITDLIPSVPKLGNVLGPLCQTVELLARHTARLEHRDQGDTGVKRPLDVIHDLWKLLDASLRSTIEKRVSALTQHAATTQLEALREGLKVYLVERPSVAFEMYSGDKSEEPPLSTGLEADIVSWEWYFDRLVQLIRSSQMQLRVYAATSMCQNLVNIWRRFSDSSDEEERNRLLNRIGSYLLRTNLVKYLFGPNCHPEIIVESANIIGFLVINKQYEAAHTEQLWSTITTTQDPRISEALCKMVINIASLFDYEGLLGLCAKLQTLPIRNFTPAIRQLWAAVLKHMTDKVHANDAAMTFHPYQLCLHLLRESSICTGGGSILAPELQSTALQGLREVLEVGDEETRRQHRQQLFTSCLRDLAAKSSSTLGSLWALSLAIRPAVASELSLLTEQHGLTQLVVEELHHAVQSSRDAGATSVLCGAHNHPRREFVAQIIQHEPLTLEGKLGTQLWDVLVGPQAACQLDRSAGWDILNTAVRKLSFKNHYLSTCFTDRLPALPPSCFCQGVLEFVRAQVLPMACDANGSFLEDDSITSRVGLEQLWRIVTVSEDSKLAEVAIHTLSSEIYLDSPLIQTFPLSRTRQIHSSVVTRCLQLLRVSANSMRDRDQGGNAEANATPSIKDECEETTEPQRVFDRTIQLLVNFLGRYRSKPAFAMPDLRSFMPEAPSQVEGDLTQLKYQSFDGKSQTDVKPLNIGNLNTAASLLARLREETGFDNYRAFYRGRPFVPTEDDVCKSLQDLQVREGLILVKKEEDELVSPSRVKAGSSPLEVELSGHFDELQGYLDLAEPMARQVLNFLTMLPADQYFMRIFEDSARSHRDIFPPSHPFRTLYAVHTLMPYLDAVQKAASRREEGTSMDKLFVSTHSDATQRCLHWISAAISDRDLSSFENLEVRFEIQTQLMCRFRRLLNVPRDPATFENMIHPPAEQFLELLSNVLSKGKANQVSELVGQTLAAILRLGLSSTTIWDKFTQTPGFAALFQDLILREPRQEVRLLLTRLIDDVLVLEAQRGQISDGNDVNRGPLTMFLWKNLSVLLEEAEDHAGQSFELFKTCTALLKHISASYTEEARTAIANTTRELAHILLQHESIEEPGRPEVFDVFTHSVVTMLLFCLDTDNISTAVEVLPSDFAASLIDRHLFPRLRQDEEEPVPKVILHPETRKHICEVVSRLVQYDRPSLKAVLPALHRLLPYYSNREDDVYHYDLPYGNFDRDKFIRASCGYTGLRNLSNTCYLNSLVNQLFMNPRFRSFLLSVKGNSRNKEPRLLNATKRLLSYLQESWHPWVDPEEFVSTLKTFEETPIDVHSQMDVDEFYNLLFDQWEGEMDSSENKRQLRSFFGGQLVQQVKSKECEHISERLEPFSAIQCDIKGKNTLDASLQAYVDGEIMEGDNKYKCSTCDRHVDAVKRACLKDIPDNLIFHLKRFDFNLRTLQRSKINDYFSFPLEIDMAPYTIEHLSDPSRSEPDLFELVGVLVHSGTAESGHYYSYIKERPTSTGRANWFEFNDEAVSQWDANFLEHATFGGYDYRSADDPNCVKSYSAYMLFYQRSSSLEAEQSAINRAELASSRISIDPSLKNHILDENTLLLRRYCLFDLSHPMLVSQCVQEARRTDTEGSMGLVRMRDASPDSDSESSDSQTNHELQTSGTWLALNHFDQVVTRATGLPYFSLYHELLQSAVTSCTDCAAQVLEYFRRRAEAFRSLLQRNQDPEVRRFAGELLLLALQKLAEDRPWAYQPTAPLTPSGSSVTDGRSDDGKVAPRQMSVPESMRIILRHLWKGFHASIRAWDEIFSFVHGFGKLGAHETAVLLSEDWLLKSLRIVAADAAIETRPNYQRMLQALSRRSRPASFSAVISLIDFLLEALEQVVSAESIVEEPSDRLGVDPPFPWTSQEVSILLHHPRWRSSSLFVEKLVALEQSPIITDQILCRLMDAGDVMHLAVFSTLRNNIPGDAAAPLMNPFLRAAVCCVKNTQSLDFARKLVFHVACQAGKLQHGEGLAFVEFFKNVMSGGFAQDSFGRDIREKALENVPDWAPALLVSFEPIVRQVTSAFLDEQIFDVHAELDEQARVDDDESPEGPRALQAQMREVVQNLGVNCLIYLRDSHVKPQNPISKDAAESILRVITACRSFCHTDEVDSDMEHAAAYRVLYAEVLPALQPQIVEELDADVSEWDGSAASSEVGISDHLTRDITDVA